MNCIECRTPMGEPTTETVPYACGLPEVYLQDVRVWRCPACGDEEVEIPEIESLHQALAEAVAAQPQQLTAAEIRFIRETKGWSSTMAAKEMGVALGTWSKWERGKLRMSPSMERLLRLMAVVRTPVAAYPDLGARAPERPPRFAVRRADEHWQMAAK